MRYGFTTNYDPYASWFKEYEYTSSTTICNNFGKRNNFYQSLMDKWEDFENKENKKGEDKTMTKFQQLKM